MVNVDDPDPVIVVGLNVPCRARGQSAHAQGHGPGESTGTANADGVSGAACPAERSGWREWPRRKSPGAHGRQDFHDAQVELVIAGAVSLIVTVVPLSGVTLFCRCTQ